CHKTLDDPSAEVLRELGDVLIGRRRGLMELETAPQEALGFLEEAIREHGMDVDVKIEVRAETLDEGQEVI
ncbi:MAG: hypothetical protein WC943_17905, partial [Elusimicrobiota bacterium]